MDIHKEEPGLETNHFQYKPLVFVDRIIEYSHIYTDQEFSKEHQKSIKLLHRMEAEAHNKDETTCRCVLIDNYNPTVHTLDIDKFIIELGTHKAKPDFVVLEHTLTIYAIYLINRMKNKLQKRYLRYIRSRNKMPCSLLLAVWHAIKLGYIELDYNAILYKGTSYKGQRLTVILPERFKEVEILGQKVFKSCNLGEIIDKIEYIYF